MVKKFFLLLLVAMLNVVAWAADVIRLTPPSDANSYNGGQYISTVNFTKFTEPTVIVRDETEKKDVTSKYNISYSIKSNNVEGTSSFDDRGVEIITDNGTGSLNTGTTVEKYYGSVKMGSAGDVTIIVTATPKAGGDALTDAEYTIHISPLSATPKFVPAYASAELPSTHDGRIVVTSVVKSSIPGGGSTSYYIPSGKSVLPKLVITTENAGGVVTDITNRFNVSIKLKSNGSECEGNKVTNADGSSKVTYADGAITYNGFGSAWKTNAIENINQEKLDLAALNLTLEYTIEPKTAYAGQYESFTRTIDVIVDVADENTKRNLALDLTEDCFSNATVDAYEKDGKAGYKITVYKYPSKNDKYKVPVPALKTSDGAIISMGKNGDTFLPVFVIEEDKTYFDDCSYMYSTRTGSVQAAGEPTGIMINNPTFQVGKPGLVRVAMYGGVATDNYNLAEMEQLYESKGIIKEKTGTGSSTEYMVFTDPVYFYVDILKRNPTIALTPDPSELYFLKDHEITMDKRFEISASIDSSHDGESGSLIWGANDGYSDHFAYQFFISDRMDESLIDIDWRAYDDPVLGDIDATRARWASKGGDQYSFIDWHTTGYTSADQKKIQAGDIIKTGNTITFIADRNFVVNDEGTYTDRNLIGQTITIGGESILVTPGNIAQLVGVKSGGTYTVDEYVLITGGVGGNIGTYLKYEDDGETVKAGEGHPYLKEGDFEKGITYNSMKQYGNENWTITFKADGTYSIPYTVRPWNHVKWDNSAEVPVKFIIKEHIPTELLLSYYFQIATKGQSSFDEPTKKVIVPSENNLDITSESTFSYAMTDGFTLAGTTYTHTQTGTTLDATTGEVTIGNLGTGDVHIKVSVPTTKSGYDVPTPKTYTIRIVDGAGLATWEIISDCRKVEGDKCAEYTADPTKQRFDFDVTGDLAQARGRMHFLTDGDIYGGTEIEGVPGISMTIGAPAADEHALADWETVATSESTPRCCAHETTPVIVRSKANVILDEDGIPTGGAFYQFNPTVNGYLTVDAKYYKNRTIVLITRSKDGVVVEERFTNPGSGLEYTSGVKATFDSGGNLLGDYTFKNPLIAGETYYLYDISYSMEFNVHGFRYEPAFIIDRSTTIEQSRTPLSATTFVNSLSNSLPVLYNGTNSDVVFSLPTETSGKTVSDYLEFLGSDGALNTKAITIDDESNIFKIRVTATVHSTKESTLGDCIAKETYYDVSIIDIPTYIIGSRTDYDKLGTDHTPAPGLQVTTENISTDITMTFGGWSDTDGKYAEKGLSDEWQYKSAAGAASRIGSEGTDDDPTYNKTIDGFNYFIAAVQNPINEENMAALQKGSDTKIGNGNSYSYGSGTDFETSTTKYYNTTYRLPCRGAYLKFEPRESGTLLLYLVQNGSVDYHYGLSEVGKTYQIKWRPLYITDETGKPVEMEDRFGNVSQYLPTGTDMAHPGSFTLGISRCNKVEEEIANSFTGGEVENGCSFDWSEFKGTAADRTALLAAWPAKGERESMVRLQNGGFSLPHKAYVRYAFHVKAGKTYFVFQPGSKFEFGGFSFVPTGFPNECKYTVTSHPAVPSKSQTESLSYNGTNQEKLWNNGAPTSGTDPTTDKTFTWAKNATIFTTAAAEVDNMNVTINDRRNSELAGDNNFKHRAMPAGKWESLCLPFSVSEQEMKRVFGDDYVLLTCDGVNERERLHFIRHANRYVEAGRPYLIKPSTSVTELTFRNISIEATEKVRNIADNADVNVTDRTRFNVNVNDEYTFMGTYYRETVKQNSYFVDTERNRGEGIYKLTDGNGKLGGYRAFFQLKDGESSQGQNFLALEFEDYTPDGIESGEPTGILVINADSGDIRTVNRTEGVYSINGQKYSNNPLDLNSAPSGIYIMGGHKYIK